MAVKRFFGGAVRLAQKPLVYFWRFLLRPIIFYCYRLVRLFRKHQEQYFSGAELGRRSHYSIHFLVLVICLIVAGANLQARDRPTPLEEDIGRHSILSKVSASEMEDLMIEQGMPEKFAKEVIYLGPQATRPQTRATGPSPSETTEGLVLSEANSIFNNVLRAQNNAAVAESANKTRSEIIEHTVQSGESIGSIAQNYGLLVATVLNANNLTSRSVIRPGQKLKILPVDGVLYTVKKGDTLTKIASQYKSAADQILEFNSLASAGALTVGKTLILPGGRLPPPPAPTASRVSTNLRQVFSGNPSTSGARFLWPTAARRITQYYHVGHTGVDIAGPVGTPLYAADDGVVIYAGWNSGGYGNMTIIDHGNGWFTRYGHASRLLAHVGDVVNRGDVVALMGSTGRSTGSHLHFEIMVRSLTRRVNPLDYIR